MPTNATKNLHGKTIIITGASSGIGRSCALEFARLSPQNLSLILTARRVDKLHSLAGQITKEVGQGVKIHAVSKPEQVSKLWSELPAEFSNVDVLVNNAGFMSGYERAPDIPSSVIDDVWATNVTGVINMTQAFLKGARKRGEGGRGDIVMIGSIAGREAYAGGSIYWIRVFTVDPGQVLTVSVLRQWERVHVWMLTKSDRSSRSYAIAVMKPLLIRFMSE
jgi:3-hydroxy acid dehydrogenase/malonic semialdehyde reductase